MKPKFTSLPEDCDLVQIADAVRDIVQELRRSGYSYEAIHKAIKIRTRRDITAVAIRLFVTRDGNTAYRASNSTLAALYDFILHDPEKLPETVRKKVSVHSRQLLGGIAPERAERILACALATQYQDWLEVPPKKVDNMIGKLCGTETKKTFAVLRKSAVKGWYVKSNLEVTRPRDAYGVVCAKHSQSDRQDVQKIATGVLIPVESNIYGVFKLERGEALEFLCLCNPVQSGRRPRFVGFLNGLATDRRPYAAAVVMRDNVGVWERLPGRFRLDDSYLNDAERKDISREVAYLTDVVCAQSDFVQSEEEASFVHRAMAPGMHNMADRQNSDQPPFSG